MKYLLRGMLLFLRRGDDRVPYRDGDLMVLPPGWAFAACKETHMVPMGAKATDMISGFTGIVVGRCEYITGCNQVLLAPRGNDPSQKAASEWFDEQRITVDASAGVVRLQNDATPGPDREAPRI